MAGILEEKMIRGGLALERKILYTYRSSHFNDFHKDALDRENVLINYPFIKNTDNINEANEDEDIIIDITSLIKLIKKHEENIYNTEQVLNALNEDVKIVIDEKYADDALSLLRYNFYAKETLEETNDAIDIESKEVPDEDTKKRIVNRVVDIGNEQLPKLYNSLNERLFGHLNFKNKLYEKIKSFIVFNNIGEHKILSIFLLGPSGVGKTEVARIIHSSLSLNNKIAKINFGNYGSKDALNSLIGSPRGYIGSETGELKEKINKSDSGIILIDEFEKADTQVFNFFLELLEDGKYTDSLGGEIDLDGYIIIFTSNLSSANFEQKLPAELRSRFDYVCEFKALTNENKENYVKSRAKQLVEKFNSNYPKPLDFEQLQEICSIDVKQFDNLRDINKSIKDNLLRIVDVLGFD
jgi:ATP-dependent Clp protease ATP-binding subunit ClpA